MSYTRMMDQTNQKQKEEKESLLRSQYADLLCQMKMEEGRLIELQQNEDDVKEKMEAIFSDLHARFTQAQQDAPLMKDVLSVVAELVNYVKTQFIEEAKIAAQRQTVIMKAEALQKAVTATLDPTVASENKLSAIATFETVTQPSLVQASFAKSSSTFNKYHCSAMLAGALLGLVVGVVVAIATGGLAALIIVSSVMCGAMLGNLVGGALGAFKSGKEIAPTSLGSKLKELGSHTLFSPPPTKSTPEVVEARSLMSAVA